MKIVFLMNHIIMGGLEKVLLQYLIGWLYFIEDGKTAYKLNDVSFFYRQHHTSSMVADLRNNYKKTRYSILKIVSHHIKIYDDFDKLFKLIYPCECVCGPYRNRNKFIENIFSIKNNQTCTYKIITVLWIKIPIKRGNKQ